MTIKRTLYLLLLTSLLSSCMKSSPVLFSKLEGNFNEGWEFVKDPADSISPELFKKSDLQQSTWQKVTLPHTANIEAVDSQENNGREQPATVSFSRFQNSSIRNLCPYSLVRLCRLLKFTSMVNWFRRIQVVTFLLR